MITVLHTPPQVEPTKDAGWEMTFWLGDPFDYSIPFRDTLAEIASILERTAPMTLDLPPYTTDEDFVEGAMTSGTASITVYYEYALGYLSLISTDRALLESVAERVLPLVRVA